jgi:hypothetical protein
LLDPETIKSPRIQRHKDKLRDRIATGIEKNRAEWDDEFRQAEHEAIILPSAFVEASDQQVQSMTRLSRS